MGNAFGCSSSGERLVSAARDGDLVEAKMLLHLNPVLARYSTFGSLNSPLHFASAKGHSEVAALLLENGADVNSRNYCGHTPLMHACRHGHWEVVQTLLLFKSTTMKADYLSGRTALHFAAVNGHVRCIRLLLADFVPSAPYEEAITSATNGDRNDGSSRKSALSKFVNKVADGGVTALHMAALNGYSDCVQLLLDIHANVSAVTFHYGTWKDLIGAGSTPLHYAACGGNLKCCQMLLARGASRLTLNYNGYTVFSSVEDIVTVSSFGGHEMWLPLDVARVWGRRWLEPWLDPNSPTFPPSKYLSLPLMSIVNIARDSGLQSSTGAANDGDICAVCLERVCSVAAEGCKHGLCVKCALYLCSTSNIASEIGSPPGSIPCPLCRSGIISFIKLHGPQEEELKQSMGLGLCTPCMLDAPNLDPPVMTLPCSIRRNRVASVSSDLLCPVSCSSFPSLTIPSCTCNHSRCPSLEHQDGETQDQSHLPQSIHGEQDKMDVLSIERTSCSSTCWNRRSNHREQQCKSEINV